MELLAPAGNWSMLTAAIKAGANAIYFGIKGLNMRVAAQNFELEDIPKIIEYCHEHNVKAYCTINVIIFQSELQKLNKLLTKLQSAQIDAVICWDLAVIKKCQELKIPIHLSTQASVSNSQAALKWKELGVSRIVLARECSMEDVAEIQKKSDLEVELFVHGARCISLSGRCFMSYDLFGKSANRGECLQPCRREYTLTDEEGKQMVMNNNFALSAKDLCTLPLLPQLLKLNVSSLKIEGRNRGPEYVFKIVSAYKEAIQAIQENKWNEELLQRLMTQVGQVYNKGFSSGFLVNYPHHERSDVYGSKASQERIAIGKIINYYTHKKVAEIRVDSSSFEIGDIITITGPTTGFMEVIVTKIISDHGPTQKAEKGEIVTVPISERARENDVVYLIKKRTSPLPSSKSI